MYLSVARYARFRDILSLRFTKKSEPKKEILSETPITSDDRASEDYDENDVDTVRARGVLKHVRPYDPPSDLEQRMMKIVRDAAPSTVSDRTSMLDLSLAEDGGNETKFRICAAAEETFGKRIPASYLHELKTVGDLVAFYRVPVKNVTSYVGLARSKDRPGNVHIAEDPQQYHPLTHGETAFPGLSKYVTDLRERQFDKGFRAKTAWHHYKDKHFDYDASPPGCPWDKKKADRYDVNNFRLRPDFP